MAMTKGTKKAPEVVIPIKKRKKTKDQYSEAKPAAIPTAVCKRNFEKEQF